MVFDWFRRQFKREEDTPEPGESTPTPAPAADQPTITPTATPTADAAPPASSTPPVSPDDYLAWAKAAYQNIQRQQTETVATPPAEAPAAPTEPTPDATVEPISEATPEPVTEPVGEAVTEAGVELAPEAVPDLATEPVTAPAREPAPSEALAPPPEAVPRVTEPEPTPATPTPIAASPEIPPEVITEVITEVTSEEVSGGPVSVPVSPEPVAAAGPEGEPAVAPTAEPTMAAAPLPFWAKAEAERQERLERLKASAIEEPEPEPEPTPAAPEPEVAITGLAFDENFIWSAEVLAAQGRRPEEVSVEEITWLKRLRQGLDKTRRGLVNQLKAIVGQGPLNQAAVMEIEALLLQADVGIEATDYIIGALQAKLREEALPPEQAIAYLKSILREMLDRPLQDTGKSILVPEKDRLNIWLITGVNGAGKTTTIGKLAHLARKSDYRCLIAAADTFRAAAVEQVKVWGQRSKVEVIANPGKNTDPAAVVYDAITAAQSRGTELLLVDTAGRLQNKKNLMDELNKIRRVIDKQASGATIESLLVLDATLGQNGLRQAEVFSEAANLSGVILTKLDSTAKGGVALAIVQQLGLPIYFIGAGEGITDLRPFSSYEFVEALISG